MNSVAFGLWNGLLLTLVSSVTAPLPPCTPFLWLNKFVESNNWSSDMSPFYPIEPCPFEDPSQAPLHLQYAIASPKRLVHQLTNEFSWLVTKGIPRAVKMLKGQEKFRVDLRIRQEGHQKHHTDQPRRQHFGRKTYKTKDFMYWLEFFYWLDFFINML